MRIYLKAQTNAPQVKVNYFTAHFEDGSAKRIDVDYTSDFHGDGVYSADFILYLTEENADALLVLVKKAVSIEISADNIFVGASDSVFDPYVLEFETTKEVYRVPPVQIMVENVPMSYAKITKENRLIPLVIHYSFDSEVPVRLYKTEEEAVAALKKLYEAELTIQLEENERVLGKDLETDIAEDGRWASITTYWDDNKDVTEWAIGTVYD